MSTSFIFTPIGHKLVGVNIYWALVIQQVPTKKVWRREGAAEEIK